MQKLLEPKKLFRVGEFVVTEEGTGKVTKVGADNISEFVEVRLDRGDNIRTFPSDCCTCDS